MLIIDILENYTVIISFLIGFLFSKPQFIATGILSIPSCFSIFMAFRNYFDPIH